MTPEIEPMIQSLALLARAAAQPSGDARTTAARTAAGALTKLAPTLWLPREDIAYYRGVAELLGSHLDSADHCFTAVGNDSPCCGEALWQRAVIASQRLDRTGDPSVRAALFEVYARLVDAFPLCPLAQIVSDHQTDRAEAAAPVRAPRSVPSVKLGRRHDWQTLTTIADLYRRQGLFAEAARAYAWSVEVRYPDIWVGDGVASAWNGVADCYEQSGDPVAAFRWLAKCLALPLASVQISNTAVHLARLAQSTPNPPSARAPDASSLAHIGDLLLSMEMFDHAEDAYRMAADHGFDARFALARVAEARGAFLFDYRRERSPATILGGQTLTWQRIADGFGSARQQYRASGAPQAELDAADARCTTALDRIKQLSVPGD